MSTQIYVSTPVAWAPGIETMEAWQEWKQGNLSIQKTTQAPAISFTTPLFRRRLNQLCKMVIQAVHDIIETTGCGDIKQIFASTYGDIKRQYDVSYQALIDKEILPTAFSYSVFNAPIALASLACQLKSGYSVVFPTKGKFKDALLTAAASVLSGDEEAVIFVYGNELIPQEYENHYEKFDSNGTDLNEPFVFATVISSKKSENSRTTSTMIDIETEKIDSAQNFLKRIL